MPGFSTTDNEKKLGFQTGNITKLFSNLVLFLYNYFKYVH
jgi:hypothetical protein